MKVMLYWISKCNAIKMHIIASQNTGYYWVSVSRATKPSPTFRAILMRASVYFAFLISVFKALQY